MKEGESVDNSGDMKKNEGKIFSVKVTGGKRNKGRKEWESERLTVVLYSGETSLHLKKFVPLWVWEKARDKGGKKESQGTGQSNGQRRGWDWYRFGTVSLSKLPAW